TAESEASLILSKPIMQKTIDYLLFLLDQSYVKRAIQMTLETRQIPEVLLACDVARSLRSVYFRAYLVSFRVQRICISGYTFSSISSG
ncbi:hypothetical protein S245_036669, partial [Arachis hypogaea]